jgi:hypothetical protein
MLVVPMIVFKNDIFVLDVLREPKLQIIWDHKCRKFSVIGNTFVKKSLSVLVFAICPIAIQYQYAGNDFTGPDIRIN